RLRSSSAQKYLFSTCWISRTCVQSIGPPSLLVLSRSPFGDGADSEISCRLATCVHSGALGVCAANPGDHRRIHIAYAREANAEAHRVVTVHSQAADGVLPVEPEAEVDARPRRRLHGSEGPSRGGERDERLSRLDDDRPAGLRRLHHRVENRAQLRTVTVLIRHQARAVW